jgi:hypothetical protein
MSIPALISWNCTDREPVSKALTYASCRTTPRFYTILDGTASRRDRPHLRNLLTNWVSPRFFGLFSIDSNLFTRYSTSC